MNEQILAEYRKLRKESRPAAEALRWAKRRFVNEMEKKITGFSFVWERNTPHGREQYTVTKDGKEYVVRVEYDSDYNALDWGDITLTNKKPSRHEYARECVVEIGSRRDKQWLCLEESPRQLARHYSKRGMARGPAYEAACAQSVRIRDWAARVYDEGHDCFIVWIDEGDENIECCGGVDRESLEEFVWDNLP